jgi:hypothetical protein
MLRLFSLFLVSLVGMMTAVHPVAEEPHPYAKAKVGDWIDYQDEYFHSDGTPLLVAGRPLIVRMRQTVTSKGTDTVSVKSSFLDVETPPFKPCTLNLKEPLNPVALIGLDDKSLKEIAAKTKFKVVASGKEPLNLGGTNYSCRWTKWAYSVEVDNAKKSEGEFTCWFCDTVPLNGAVKVVGVSKEKVDGETKEMKMTRIMRNFGTAK